MLPEGFIEIHWPSATAAELALIQQVIDRVTENDTEAKSLMGDFARFSDTWLKTTNINYFGHGKSFEQGVIAAVKGLLEEFIHQCPNSKS